MNLKLINSSTISDISEEALAELSNGRENGEPDEPLKCKLGAKSSPLAYSTLVSYISLSPNCTSPRNHDIDTITIHCMAGNLSIESCGYGFSDPSRQASSNYGIGTDGRIGMYVDENDRSWCTCSRSNDNRAITIEVANDGGADTGWHVSDEAYASLIALVTDICQRYGITQLLWQGDSNLIGQIDQQNMTVHRWFAQKACPGDYLFNMHYDIANAVNFNLSTSSLALRVANKIGISYDYWIKILRGNESANATYIRGLFGKVCNAKGLSYTDDTLYDLTDGILNLNSDDYWKDVIAGQTTPSADNMNALFAKIDSSI